MLTRTDIIRKTLAGVPDPGSMPIWDPGYEFPDKTYAWIHPDKCSVLFLTEEELEFYHLSAADAKPAHWLTDQLRSALLINPGNLIREKHVLAGKQRILWFNRTPNTPLIIDTVAIENRFVQRYIFKHARIYQTMESPHGYFFMTENMIPYAYALPVRIYLETVHDWRV